MDGYEVMPGIDAAREGDIFITVTGDKHAIGGRHFGVMKSGAIVANSGHFNVEIDIPALIEMSVAHRAARPFVEEYELSDGRRIFLLGEGRLINLAAAEGHPAAVMDMSFANQALSAEFIAKNASELERKVYVVPEDIDKEIAKLKLETMGIAIDELTAEQEKYLASWDEGT
jgi:adenosylhomocysteinase